jgi:hypothetical protein
LSVWKSQIWCCMHLWMDVPIRILGRWSHRMIQSGDLVDVSYQTLWAYEPAKMGIWP